MVKFLSFCVVCLLGCLGVLGQAELRGGVVDQTGKPVAFATIRKVSNNNYLLADEDGNFSLPFADSLEVSCTGYKPAKIFFSKSEQIILEKNELPLQEVFVRNRAPIKTMIGNKSRTAFVFAPPITLTGLSKEICALMRLQKPANLLLLNLFVYGNEGDPCSYVSTFTKVIGVSLANHCMHPTASKK